MLFCAFATLSLLTYVNELNLFKLTLINTRIFLNKFVLIDTTDLLKLQNTHTNIK